MNQTEREAQRLVGLQTLSGLVVRLANENLPVASFDALVEQARYLIYQDIPGVVSFGGETTMNSTMTVAWKCQNPECKYVNDEGDVCVKCGHSRKKG